MKQTHCIPLSGKRFFCLFFLLLSLTLSSKALAAKDYNTSTGMDRLKQARAKKEANSPVGKAQAAARTLIEGAGKKSIPLDTQALETLLDFVAQSQGSVDGTILKPAGKAKGVIIDRPIQVPLPRILKYAYNPAIPASGIFPSIIRLAASYPASGASRNNEKLWEYINRPGAPHIFYGREYEELTPDAFSGAYYRYDLNRTQIVTTHKGHNVFISIANQPEPSAVGRKGVTLDDTKWEYFYSGMKGLTKGGLSWMDTHIYDSSSIAIFYEKQTQPVVTHYMAFKWLYAGWTKMNVVKEKNILEGGHDFVKEFRSVLESPALPPAEELAAKWHAIQALPEKEVDKQIQAYAKKMETSWKAHPELQDDSFAKLLKNGAYARTLNREERLAVLFLEYMRTVLQ